MQENQTKSMNVSATGKYKKIRQYQVTNKNESFCLRTIRINTSNQSFFKRNIKDNKITKQQILLQKNKKTTMKLLLVNNARKNRMHLTNKLLLDIAVAL